MARQPRSAEPAVYDLEGIGGSPHTGPGSASVRPADANRERLNEPWDATGAAQPATEWQTDPVSQ